MLENYLNNLMFTSCICNCVSRVLRSAHVVQPGESLWLIASKYGVNPERLIASNPQIKNPDMIFPGQVVIVPCC